MPERKKFKYFEVFRLSYGYPNSTLPQAIKEPFAIITAPNTPFMDLAKFTAFSKSSLDVTRLAQAVATASAKDAFLDKITTLSALPKLKEWPTVPEDVHMPIGVSFGYIFKKSLFFNLEVPG